MGGVRAFTVDQDTQTIVTMKVLYLAFVRLPTEKAHGIQIMKTCEALAQQGATVELVVPTRSTAISDDPFSYYGIKTRFSLMRIRTPDFVRFGKIGFIVSALWFSERVRFMKHFWAQDTVIYSRDALVLLQYVLLGRRLVYEAHAEPSLLSAFVARRAARVIVITESLRQAFVLHGVPEKRICVVHDAVDAYDSKMTRAELGMPNGVVVLYAGSRGKGKGVETLEAAAPRVPGTVLIVSDKPPSIAREMLAQADVVVVPNSARYLSWSTYTSPMKLFEALASGALVVVSDVPATREVVNEDSVWFFKPDDPQSLVDTISEALTDPHREEKRSRARAVAKEYTWQARAKKIYSAL